MSIAVAYSRAQMGIQSPLVTVETFLGRGLPCFSMVGLPETAVKESKDRVKSALLNSNFEFPVSRIVVNLAPADLPKEGGRFDLPIAISILAAMEQIPKNILSDYEIVGELALTGEIRSVQGVLPVAIATQKTYRKLIVPVENADEAALVKDLIVLPARHILDIAAYLCGKYTIAPHQITFESNQEKQDVDISDVRGQPRAKRALEIAAAGGHNLLFIGPPGTGKSMLASRMPTILPSMTDEESIQSAAVLSISHKGFHYKNWKKRLFRSPHHSASSVALVGGGNPPQPGEISLAHCGVLFLDELPEFNRHVLEALREPLETGRVTISRAARQSEFPADFQLIAAMNPCPCGYLGDPQQNCRCTQEQIQKYRMRISGPILDRIDMHVEVPRLNHDVLSLNQKSDGESSETVKSRIEKSREKQINRATKSNAKLNAKELEKYAIFGKEEQALLDTALQKLKLSARGYHRIIKVALTIADLDGSDRIQVKHISEALSYRQLR